MKSIIIKNLIKAYGKKIVVKNINLEVNSSEIVGLIGPNGAGKTTLLKMICGLILPTQGQILIDGKDIFIQKKEVMKKIGVVFEGNRNLYWRLTPLENLFYFGNLKGYSTKDLKDIAKELFQFWDIWEYRNIPLRYLSKGTQQKVALSISLVTEPIILIWDEPTNSLDLISFKLLKEKLQTLANVYKKTIILATHQIELFEVFTRVVFLNKGEILLDIRKEELLNNNFYIIEGIGESILNLKETFTEDKNLKISIINKTILIEGIFQNYKNLFTTVEKLAQNNIKIMNISLDSSKKIENLYLKMIAKKG